MTTGIYCITVSRPQKPDLFYIGQAIDLERRWQRHRRHLCTGVHDNRRIQSLFDKYGAGALSFKTVIVCESGDLCLYEQAVLDFNIATYRSRVLNICRRCVRSPAGVKRSALARARMRDAQLRRDVNPRLGIKGVGGNCKMVICHPAGLTFQSIGLAVDWLQLNGWPKANTAAISLACNGRRKLAYGYGWQFVNNAQTQPLVDTGLMLNTVDHEVE